MKKRKGREKLNVKQNAKNSTADMQIKILLMWFKMQSNNKEVSKFFSVLYRIEEAVKQVTEWWVEGTYGEDTSELWKLLFLLFIKVCLSNSLTYIKWQIG